MESFLKKNKYYLTILVLFFIFGILSVVFNFEAGLVIAKNNFLPVFLKMLYFLPLMFILIGLFQVWVPKEKVMKYIGKNSGVKGFSLILFLATLQAGPLYATFPVSYSLWKKGASMRNIFMYLGFFSSVKIPMLTFEIAFLGLKFSILRIILSITAFALIALVMEKFFIPKNYEINEV